MFELSDLIVAKFYLNNGAKVDVSGRQGGSGASFANQRSRPLYLNINI
jgi:hypothetical protein